MSNLKIVEAYLTNNPCYKTNRTITVKGLMLHSVGCPQPSAKVFVNNWNKASYTAACVHAFIDANDGTVYQTLPWTHRAWHCGDYANNTHIGVEMCEPAQIVYVGGASFKYDESKLPTIQKAITTAYDSAVKLFASLCKTYNLDPLADGVIISHREGYLRGWASNHGDPEHLWSQAKMPYTMDGFRKAVAECMGKEPSVEPDDKDEEVETPDVDEVKHLYRVRKSADDAASQIGAFSILTNATNFCDRYPGYSVYDETGALVYPKHKVPFYIQVRFEETPLTIYKSASTTGGAWSSTVKTGVYTIVKIQNGSGSKEGFGLLKAYSDRSNGYVNLDDVKHYL